MRKCGWIAFALMTFALPMLVLAQPAGGPGGGGPGGGFGPGGPGGPGGFNMMDVVKEALVASDDEWKIIEPKLQKVMDTQRLVGAGRGGRGGMGGGRGGFGGPGGPGGAPPVGDDAVSKTMAELRTALESPDTKAEVLTQKLTALRSAREKATADLTAARKLLKEVLTARQEAVLVTYGYLE